MSVDYKVHFRSARNERRGWWNRRVKRLEVVLKWREDVKEEGRCHALGEECAVILNVMAMKGTPRIDSCIDR